MSNENNYSNLGVESTFPGTDESEVEKYECLTGFLSGCGCGGEVLRSEVSSGCGTNSPR